MNGLKLIVHELTNGHNKLVWWTALGASFLLGLWSGGC